MVDEQQEKKIMRRAPYIPTSISGLSSNMSRVCITGTVVNKNSELGSFVLDDGDSSIMVLANVVGDVNGLREGQVIRVLGKPVGEDEETEILADMVQTFSNVDLAQYKKVML